MELICAKPTYSSKHLELFFEVTIEHSDGITQALALRAPGNWILIKLPQHIFRR